MSQYHAPLAEMQFVMNELAGLRDLCELPGFEDATPETVGAILKEAGKFATGVLDPLNRIGDREGARLTDEGRVVTPPGFREAYEQFVAAGWNGLASPAEWGGQGLPRALNAACIEMWNSASMAFGIGPVLTMAGIDALALHGSDDLKETYLPKLISGEWMGTMQLTEPQAGSDVGALRTRAERADDGSYRIFGQKIFITYGEHEMTDNIIHFVLARLPDAPAGTRGLSLFLVYGAGSPIGRFLIDHGITVIFAVPGMVLATIFVCLPFVVREVVPVLREIGTDQEEAAYTLGAGPIRTFVQVLLPLSVPGMIAGSLLVFTMAIAAYTTPVIMGGNRVLVMATFIGQQFRTVLDYALGATAAAVLMLLAGVLTVLAVRLGAQRAELAR